MICKRRAAIAHLTASILAVCLLSFAPCVFGAGIDHAELSAQATPDNIAVASAGAGTDKNQRLSAKATGIISGGEAATPVNSLPRASLREVYGWKFIEHVCLESDLTSKSAKPGDIVWGLLDDDCKWGSKLIAARDSLIKGHVVEANETRTLLGASLSPDRRYHSGGSLTIQFDEIVDQDGQSWPIVGKLCRWSETSETTTGGAPRLVEVDKQGHVVKAGPTLTDKEKSIFAVGRVITSVPIPMSVALNVAGVPALMGVLGAAYPAFVYNRPVNLKEKAVRQKAFVYGFITNLPGAFAVAACLQKGDLVDLKAGDQVVVDMTFQDNTFCSRGRLAVTGSVVSNLSN